MQVTGLTPGGQYQFRVSAENFYGRSDASEATSLTTMEQVSTRRKGKDGKDVNLLTKQYSNPYLKISSSLQLVFNGQPNSTIVYCH